MDILKEGFVVGTPFKQKYVTCLLISPVVSRKNCVRVGEIMLLPLSGDVGCAATPLGACGK